MGVFENWAGKCVFEKSTQTQAENGGSQKRGAAARGDPDASPTPDKAQVLHISTACHHPHALRRLLNQRLLYRRALFGRSRTFVGAAGPVAVAVDTRRESTSMFIARGPCSSHLCTPCDSPSLSLILPTQLATPCTTPASSPPGPFNASPAAAQVMQY